jgi:hypothetical protein
MKPHSFVLPPRHRLFAIFTDPGAARKAVDELLAEDLAPQGSIWVFYGQDGLASLGGRSHGLRWRVVRLAQRAMTSDLNYLEVLRDALRDGATAIAVRVPNEPSADRLAKWLGARSADSFAYGAHWDFVPVAA